MRLEDSQGDSSVNLNSALTLCIALGLSTRQANALSLLPIDGTDDTLLVV